MKNYNDVDKLPKDCLSRDELILRILRELEIPFEQEHIDAMNEAFRHGWTRGEKLANSLK